VQKPPVASVEVSHVPVVHCVVRVHAPPEPTVAVQANPPSTVMQ
jgi:hypothetical protein